MRTTEFEFESTVYMCRIVKDNTGDNLIIAGLSFLDVLQPGNFEDENEGFTNTVAANIYDEIFYFTNDENLRLSDPELIAILKEPNPEWF